VAKRKFCTWDDGPISGNIYWDGEPVKLAGELKVLFESG